MHKGGIHTKIGALIVAIAIVSLAFLSPVFAQLEIPEPTGYVNDYENILDNDEVLEQRLSQFEEDTSNEITILTVEDFGGTTIEDYAVKVFEDWGIGKEDKDNGILVIISDTQRESRIEVGYGLEGAVTDSFSGNIQDTQMVPYFAEGDYSTGVSNGVDALIAATEGEYTPTMVEEESSIWSLIPALLVPALIFFQLIAYTKSWWFGGIVGFFAGLGYGGLEWAIGGLFAGLLIDFVLSKIFARAQSRGAGWATGAFLGSRGFSSGGSGSSSGGGFSGFGGGGSGGGGSSRGW